MFISDQSAANWNENASEEDLHGAIDNDNDDVKKEVELSIRQP